MTRPINWFTSPLYNPFWASSEIHAQVTTKRGRSMVCLAFTEEEEQLLIETIRSTDLDYRITVTDGPARHYEWRKGGHVSISFEDGMWHPRREGMEIDV